MILAKELQDIGLTNKEARVYLANLELGQSTVQDVSEKAGVNRATTYVILDSLVEKGLASTYEQGKKTHYIASSPDVLEGIFALQKKEIDEKQKYFEKLLPQLQLIDNRQSDKPVIKFFEGKQGMLSSEKEFYGLSHSDDDGEQLLRTVYPSDMLKNVLTQEDKEKFRKIRLGKKVNSRSIYTASEELESTPETNRTRVDNKEFPLAADFSVHRDMVRVVSLGKRLTAVLIKNKDIADTMKSIFDLAREAALARNKKDKETKKQ